MLLNFNGYSYTFVMETCLEILLDPLYLLVNRRKKNDRSIVIIESTSQNGSKSTFPFLQFRLVDSVHFSLSL